MRPLAKEVWFPSCFLSRLVSTNSWASRTELSPSTRRTTSHVSPTARLWRSSSASRRTVASLIFSSPLTPSLWLASPSSSRLKTLARIPAAYGSKMRASGFLPRISKASRLRAGPLSSSCRAWNPPWWLMLRWSLEIRPWEPLQNIWPSLSKTKIPCQKTASSSWFSQWEWNQKPKRCKAILIWILKTIQSFQPQSMASTKSPRNLKSAPPMTTRSWKSKKSTSAPPVPNLQFQWR